MEKQRLTRRQKLHQPFKVGTPVLTAIDVGPIWMVSAVTNTFPCTANPESCTQYCLHKCNGYEYDVRCLHPGLEDNYGFTFGEVVAFNCGIYVKLLEESHVEEKETN